MADLELSPSSQDFIRKAVVYLENPSFFIRLANAVGKHPQVIAWQIDSGIAGYKTEWAFNEDTRVQLHNIKLQQALIGLNVRQAASSI